MGNCQGKKNMESQLEISVRPIKIKWTVTCQLDGAKNVNSIYVSLSDTYFPHLIIILLFPSSQLQVLYACTCVSMCALSASMQAHIHMGASVSDTFLPAKLVRHLMIVTQPLEENSIWFIFFYFPLLHRNCHSHRSGSVEYCSWCEVFGTVTSHGGDNISQ